MSAGDRFARLRALSANEQREIMLSSRNARRFVEASRPFDAPPLDYAVDEQPPDEARPMFGLCECILLGSIVCLGLLCLWLGFGG